MQTRIKTLLGLLLVMGPCSTQKALVQWHHLDPLTDQTVGISTQKLISYFRPSPGPKPPLSSQ